MNAHAMQSFAVCATPCADGANLVEIAPGLRLQGFVMTFEENEEVFGEEEPADFVYKVVSGVCRTTRLLRDGRRQVSAFQLPGDVLGLERGVTHRGSAEAVSPCDVALVRSSVLRRAMDRDALAANQVWALTVAELERTEEHLLLLGRKTAAERVGSFLLSLSQRCGSFKTLDLPMSRSDIADHLGLTIETVSRTMSLFVRQGAIGLESARCVVLKDRDALTDPS